MRSTKINQNQPQSTTINHNQPQYLRAHGKLLLTGEYFVLDGALALAVPTRFGQSLEIAVVSGEHGKLYWKSLDEKGRIWFEGRFALPDGRLETGTDIIIGERLEQILQAIRQQRPDFFTGQSIELTTLLEFPRDWGLGSSSTLIASLAKWADIDPYRLLADTFGGSGYDIACAFAEGPVLYFLEDEKALPGNMGIDFDPPFSDQLYFVHMGEKQDSRAGIRRYRERAVRDDLVGKVTLLTKAMLECPDVETFGQVMEEHEKLVGEALGLEPVGQSLFGDFPGKIKSLGAWGGDFVMALSPWGSEETNVYFAHKQKGTVLPWKDMVWQK